MAQRQLERALDIGTHYEARPSNYEYVTGECKCLLGLAYEQMNDYDNALKYLRDGLNLQKAADVQNNVQITNNLNSLGIALSRNGEHDLAVEQYMHAVSRSRKELSNKHLLTGIILTNLSKSYEQMENGYQEKAVKAKAEGYAIMRVHFPADHAVFTLRDQGIVIPVKTRQRYIAEWEPVTVAT